jgi:hypothetical protein
MITNLKSILKKCDGEAPTFKKIIDKNNNLIFPLLRWIVSSNRSQLILLDDKNVKIRNNLILQKIQNANKGITQFLMVSAPPKREAEFREKKLKHGSFYGNELISNIKHSMEAPLEIGIAFSEKV